MTAAFLAIFLLIVLGGLFLILNRQDSSQKPTTTQ